MYKQVEYYLISNNLIRNIEISSIMELKNCDDNWCKVYSNEHNISGYIYIETIWGENAK